MTGRGNFEKSYRLAEESGGASEKRQKRVRRGLLFDRQDDQFYPIVENTLNFGVIAETRTIGPTGLSRHLIRFQARFDQES